MKPLRDENPMMTPAQFLKGVGPKRAEALKERYGIETVRDLLYHFPHRYDHFETITPIKDAQPGQDIVIIGKVVDLVAQPLRNGKTKLEMVVEDDTGDMSLLWFNPPLPLDERFDLNQNVLAVGKVERYRGSWQMTHPKLYLYELDDSALLPPLRPDWKRRPLHHSRIVPVHRLTAVISASAMRRLVYQALLDYAGREPDILSDAIRNAHHLMPITDALCAIHFPETDALLGKARRRLIFEELFLFSIGFAYRRRKEKQRAPAQPVEITPKIDARIRKRLPYDLTPSQDSVVREMIIDLYSTQPMYRLLQGDVGTGKTLVAVYAALGIVASGGQTALMAPTEVLAAQVYKTFDDILRGSSVECAFLASSTSPRDRKRIIERVTDGQIGILIGTHSLISDAIMFKDLRLAIIDEQQKFGVLQRSGLQKKAYRPHVLIMTATPIPRTLALCIYGDLTVSRLTHPPAGRGEIITRVIPETKRDEAYDIVKKQLNAGRQAFVVVPAIHRHDKMTSVESELLRLKSDKFREYTIATLHGEQAPDEQARIMAEFRIGMRDILIATSIVEVGIDVPNASVMLIEDAGNFGLMTLHQLRGRVGRSTHTSYCLLMAGETVTEDGDERLKALATTRDGLEIARADFRIRGPGRFFGTEQSGAFKMRIADLFEDEMTLQETIQAAEKLLDDDPELGEPENRALRARLIEIFGDDLKLSKLAGVG
ncbi:MAG: ATP-dependent DNA helicase RecG [Planctomycetota bacterium]